MNRAAEDIFNEARGMTPAQRAEYLASACGDDAALRKEIELLLHAHDQAGRFLAEPTLDAPRSVDSHGAEPAAPHSPEAATAGGAPSHASADAVPHMREGPGTRIGPYKLLQLIGEGGFGSVFMAEQEKPVSRRVALKIIKLGMDTRQVVARFEQERQALAMMDHPNIAKVFDAGATETGRPFFVMELVKGDPIAEFADKQSMSIDERLALFAQVCNAVQHAHTKGIIHRDIKPSNVLVSTQDGKPHAKVIDFGIAKATASKLTEKTLFTEHRQLIGTPEYMSPEQAEGSLDIDTRTDVYSLGVLLYELLTGTTPFTGQELRSAAYAEIQRIIREVEPPTPSTRLSSNAETLASVAARRQIEPKRLGTVVRGELDWIVMKALEKDRQRRYETPSGLATDIQRYLTGEAVVAAPPSTRYRAMKFYRRNRAGVIGGGVLAISLVLGIAGTTIGMIRANRSAAAERAALSIAEERRVEAETNLAFATRGNQILSSVFAELDPRAVYGSVPEFRAALRANLDEAIREIDGTAIGSSGEVIAMQRRLAMALMGLGDSARAAEILERAAAASEAALGREDPETIQILGALAGAYFGAGRLDAALPLAEETLALRTKVLGGEDGKVISDMQSVAVMNAFARNPDRATRLSAEALRLRRGAKVPDELAVLDALASVAMVHGINGRTDLAASAWEELVALMERAYGREDPRTMMAMGNLANACWSLGRFDQAVQLYQEVLRNHRDRLGRDHPGTLTTMGNLANAYMSMGKPDRALVLYEETFKLREMQLGPDHPDTLGALSHLADAVWQAGDRSGALRLSSDQLARVRAKFGSDHIDALNGISNLARKYLAAGEVESSIPLLEEAARRRLAVLGASDAGTSAAVLQYVDVLLAQGSVVEAERAVREWLARSRAALPAGHVTIATGLDTLAGVQQRSGNAAGARASWDEAVSILRSDSPQGSALLARVLWRSGSAWLESRDAVAALPQLEEAVVMGERVLPVDHADLKAYRESLARCKAAMGTGQKPGGGE